MLLFKPEHIAPILAGRKTQTRRLWLSPRVKVGHTYQARTRMLDKTSTFALLRVKRVTCEDVLTHVTEADAYAEGYDSVQEFLDAFRRINRWSPRQVGETNRILYAIEFEVVGG